MSPWDRVGDDRLDNRPQESTTMFANTPVAALTIIGSLVAVLGLFVAGDVRLLLIGIGTLVAAGLITALATRRVG
jgi:hypothetical protein